MAKNNLSRQIASRIIDHIRVNGLQPGDHLATQVLADEFRVSRAPVNAALKFLQGLKVVRLEPNRGFFLRKDAAQLRNIKLPVRNGESDEDIYFAIAEDRLTGKLPDRVSESELMRLYSLPRGRLVKILHRTTDEGWTERLPGGGWEFRPTLTSRESYEQAYRFRAAIEVAAVMEPTFRVDRAAFGQARAQQQALLDGDIQKLSRSRLFQINSHFHEMIVGCSNNEFFLDAIKRVDRLRRLLEYRTTLDRDRLYRQCREHVEILDRLERGDMPSAAAYLRVHIEGARASKAAATG